MEPFPVWPPMAEDAGIDEAAGIRAAAAEQSQRRTGSTEPRLTHREWRAFARARRAWDRRALAATGAVVLAEVAAAVAWTAWTSAMNAPRPRAGR